MSHVSRMHSRCAQTNPVDGVVIWSPVKSLWFTGMAGVAVIAGPMTWSWSAVSMSCVLTMMTLCCGHSVGFHRLLIHRSFQCSRWMEYLLVTIGTLVGMGGPSKMLYLHDSRDWAQRHPKCHPYSCLIDGALACWLPGS